jgi:archaellum component FlaG (FlaF/FlaG flagellin family)
VATSKELPDQQAELIAAARAAVSWARTRRATWTDAPLPAPPVIHDFASFAPPLPAPAQDLPPPIAAPAGPSAASRIAGQIGAAAGPVLRRLPRIAAILALLAVGGAVGIYGGRYLLNVINTDPPLKGDKPPGTAPGARGGAPIPPVPMKNAGAVEVTSTPSGAQVLLDGKPRGVTPLKLPDVSVGRHTIELRSSAGNVQRTVTVEGGKTAAVEESIFSGFLALYSPIEVVVTVGGRRLQFDERSQTMMAPGRHELRVASQALGYESVEQIEVKPGETARLTIKPPLTPVTVTANEPAEVWLDGSRIGDVPVNEMPVALGTHEIVVKRAAGGERKMTVTVTTKPMTQNVDFTKP